MLDDIEWENAILNQTIKSYFQDYDQSRIQKDNFDHFRNSGNLGQGPGLIIRSGTGTEIK